MDSSVEKGKVALQKNPLLIPPVIKRIFEYMRLEDVKQCRVVCQEWNSVSKPILNKRVKVKLDSKERMSNFLEFYKAYNDTQPFPITTFDLRFSHTNGNTEEYEQLVSVFNSLRKNITTLEIMDTGDRLHLTPLIEIATNLVTLSLTSQNSVLEFDNLAKVKYLHLTGCCVNLDSFKNRIAPLSISLQFVTFERNENALEGILINDYIDFSRCSEIYILPRLSSPMTFDMSRDIVSARKVDFNSLRVINCGPAPEKVDKRMLPFEKHTEVGIKELSFEGCELNFKDLSVLPKSLEILTLEENTYGKMNWVPIDLPNLKCLIFRPSVKDTSVEMSPTAFDMSIITSKFRLCPKLVDLELSELDSGLRSDINVGLLPVTLKRLKLSWNENINFVGDTVTHVDILILLDTGTFADTQKFMTKIKPKIVVVELSASQVEDSCNDIVSLVEESRNLEKIVIKIPEIITGQIFRSYKRALSSYVDDDDRKSIFYEFTNQVGKCLTSDESKMYWF